MGELGQLWCEAVVGLGGRRAQAVAAGRELEARYAEPMRRYHTAGHILATQQAASGLADAERLEPAQRARLVLAVCGHDVVYRGVPGEDEAASAAWTADRLARCGIAEADRDRISRAIAATAGHTTEAGDGVVDCLLDADLSILGADPARYDRYVSAVRDEYTHVDDGAWRAGRRAVLESLLARSPLYRTAEARRLWEAPARRNMEGELAALGC